MKSNMKQDIVIDDMFICDRINLINRDIYLGTERTDEDDKNWHVKKKYYKNLKHKAPKQHIKDRTSKRKEKFDNPDTTTTDAVVNKANKLNGERHVINKTAPAKNIQDLRERLKNKLENMKHKRSSTKPDRLSTQGDRNRNKKKPSPSKTKPKANKQQQQHQQQGTTSKDDVEEMLREKVTATLSKASLKPGQSISFGQIDGLGDETKEGEGKGKGEKKKQIGKKNVLNLKRMLKNAEENQAFIKELKSTGKKEDFEQAEKKEWDAIEKKALGEATPDAKKLKKELKSIEKKKKKSAKAWESRKQQEKDAVKEKMDKRQQNIENAKNKKIANKLKRKGIVLPEEEEKEKKKRPGFEGRRSKYLNGN